MGKFQSVKKLVLEYFADLESCSPDKTVNVLQQYMGEEYFWEGVYPFLDQHGVKNVAEIFWKPLKESLTHMQRRQDVFMAGVATDGNTWVMSMGQFMGLFDNDFLGIRRTCKIQHLQYAEYSCVKNGKITHTAMFVDLIGFMNEAGQYPLPPMTGHYFVYPGPRDHNGLMLEDSPAEKSAASFAIVNGMIDGMVSGDFSLNASTKVPQDAMQRFWSEDMIWYGPCGIGASYTIPRYQRQHQLPFREGLVDKAANELKAFFAEGDFVCFYSSMEVTPTGGWLGLPGCDKNVHMRGDIDIYYCKEGKIVENWCFIDLPYWLNEQGLDIFSRAVDLSYPGI